MGFQVPDSSPDSREIYGWKELTSEINLPSSEPISVIIKWYRKEFERDSQPLLLRVDQPEAAITKDKYICLNKSICMPDYEGKNKMSYEIIINNNLFFSGMACSNKANKLGIQKILNGFYIEQIFMPQ